MRRREDFDPGDQDGPSGSGPVPRSGASPRWVLAGIGVVVLLIFALQNSERIDVDFLVFDTQARVVVVILVSAAIGFVVGWLVGRPSRAQRRAMREGSKD